jgi:glycosyltransferase involved in cell wall biosynthesis
LRRGFLPESSGGSKITPVAYETFQRRKYDKPSDGQANIRSENSELFMIALGEFISQSTPDFQPVSFVIPAHNEQRYIGKTITALVKAIRDLGVTAEIIVVNDESTDDTVSVAESLGARTINVALRNIGAVRNAGARVAKYDWLIFVDADTTVPTETLRRSLVALSRGDVGGGARVEVEGQETLFWVKRMMCFTVILGWQVIGGWAAGCFMFCRKESFESFGGFDENYFAAEEFFFSRRLKELGRFRLVRHPVVTSARKLHRYSTWQLCSFIFSPLRNWRSPFSSKSGLEILYEDIR